MAVDRLLARPRIGPSRLAAVVLAVMPGGGLVTTTASGAPPGVAGRWPHHRQRRTEETTLHGLLSAHAPAFLARTEAEHGPEASFAIGPAKVVADSGRLDGRPRWLLTATVCS